MESNKNLRIYNLISIVFYARRGFMGYSLWLCGKKIDRADQIKENFDLASLRGYFIAGNLIKWLNNHGGELFAERLVFTSADDPLLNIRLQLAFDIPPKVTSIHVGSDHSLYSGGFGLSSFRGSQSSFLANSFTGNSFVGYSKPSSFSYKSSFRSSFSSSYRPTTFPTAIKLPSSFGNSSRRVKVDDDGRLSTEHITQFGYGIHLI